MSKYLFRNALFLKASLLILFCLSSYFFLSINFEKNYKYQVSIATIFRDEAPYLKEWIEYHRLIGVDHFYLYNHMSIDNPEEILQPYIDAGIVELIPTNKPYWKSKAFKPHKKYPYAQLCAYHDAIRRSQFVSQWVAFIDIDEFIVISDQTPLPDFLKEYEYAGGLMINWRLFGTSNQDAIASDQLLTQTLTWRNDKTTGIAYDHVKTIARPERTKKLRVHYFSYHKPYNSVKPDHSILRKDKSNLLGGPIDKIKLNHYYFRDKKFFEDVKLARLKDRFDEDSQVLIQRLRDKEKDTYDIEDFSIFPYLPELHRRVFKHTPL